MENDKKLRNFVKTTIREFINEQFDNKSVYEMYIDKDLNKLVEYYSMYFQKEA
jgi:hypothetical protein